MNEEKQITCGHLKAMEMAWRIHIEADTETLVLCFCENCVRMFRVDMDRHLQQFGKATVGFQ